MTRTSDQSMSTRLAHAGQPIEKPTGAVIPGIHPSTTFTRDQNYELIGDYVYSRTQNPNSVYVEQLAADLDHGAEAMLFSSGMAAIAAVFETVNSGQQIVAPTIMYYGAQDWLRWIAEKRDIELTLFDPTQSGALQRAINPQKAAIVWIETPVNPTWDVIDIEQAATLAHEAGAILGVDATVAPPVTTQALELGADLVFHSATKYMNGHSDLTAGILVTRVIGPRWEEISYVREHSGGILGSFEAWLLLRGMRTLDLRFERASNSALEIARHFMDHPKLEAVLYPGLEIHPGHAIARRQMRNGFGGMLSLCVNGGARQALAVVAHLKLFIPATSLGGVESLVEHLASVESPSSQVKPNLLRLSIGIEEVADLIADLEQALELV